MTNDNNALTAAAGLCGPEKTGFDPRDPAQLGALMELANVSTPGPMFIGTHCNGYAYDVATVYGVQRQPTEDGLGQEWVYILGPFNTSINSTPEEKLNLAKLFAASREAVPALIEEVKRLRNTLGIIGRMNPLPDDKANTVTLIAARDIAREALKGGA